MVAAIDPVDAFERTARTISVTDAAGGAATRGLARELARQLSRLNRRTFVMAASEEVRFADRAPLLRLNFDDIVIDTSCPSGHTEARSLVTRSDVVLIGLRPAFWDLHMSRALIATLRTAAVAEGRDPAMIKVVVTDRYHGLISQTELSRELLGLPVVGMVPRLTTAGRPSQPHDERLRAEFRAVIAALG